MSDKLLIVARLKGISTHLRKAYSRLEGDADLIDNAAAHIRAQAQRIEELEKVLMLVKSLEVDLQHESVIGSGEYDQGLMCGVEDRGYQRDGYSAMRYGYDRALERVHEVIDPIIEALHPAETKEEG